MSIDTGDTIDESIIVSEINQKGGKYCMAPCIQNTWKYKPICNNKKEIIAFLEGRGLEEGIK